MRNRGIATLSLRDWGLLLMAGLTVSVVRIVLWLLPSRRIVRALQQHAASPAPASRSAAVAASEIVGAVEHVSRLVPRATCLTQALAARILLGWFGHPSRLRLGVAHDARGEFRAHAWLEWQGRVLIGGSRRSLTPLPELPAAPPLRTRAPR